MSEVKRFGVIIARGVGELRECPSRNGEYVKYEDYAALKAERDALAAEGATLKDCSRKHAEAVELWNSWADKEHRIAPNPETPATDAAIAEWKAQGALVVRDALVNAPDGIGIYGFVSDVAASLRRGGE